MALLTDRKFIHFNRKSDFEAQLNANAISDKQIVFLKDAQEIWTHGTYYGSVEQFLDETNKDSTNAVSAAAVYQALADDEEVIAAALNDLNDRIENLDIPSKISDLTDDLSLATQDYVDDKLDDVLGISADGVEAFVNMTRDEDTATGILTEIVNKAPKTNAVNGAPLSNTESYFYGTSTTAAATVQKEVSIPSITSLKTGQIIVVKPTITSTVANSTIKLNNFTAYPMRYNNAAITTSTDSIVWAANIPSIWVFDGTYWVFLGHGLDSNTTYSAMSQAEASAGTSTSARTISAKVLHDTIEESVPIKSIAVNNTALTPDANKAVNIDLTEYDKAPLVIEIDNTDTTVPSGTYTSIGQALANGKEVYIKMNGADYSVIYLKLCGDFSEERSACYEFQGNTVIANIWSNNTVSIYYAEYAASEHNHGDIDNDGTLNSSQAISIANGDRIVITDASSNEKIQKTSITFDGSTTTKALTPKGTWETFLQNHQSIKTLNTNNTSAQTANASEAIAGSGTINLRKVSKTGSYSDLIKPSGGIPSTDLTSAAQTSLGKADTAIQGVKVNGTALTPDSNKTVNIDISGKQDTLTPSTPISIVQGTGSSTGTTYIKLVGSEGTDINHIVESTNNGGWEHGGNSSIPTVALVASKVDAKYTKPSTGIPKTDLTSTVQTSLGKADSAIQGVKVNGTSVTPDSNKIVDITIPEGELSTNYEPSSLDNEDLELAAGDTYEEAFGKLEKSINDNEQITAAALTDLDSRINTLHLPQSLDDIPDGSTRKLATKQDTLVSGTNIKTINNESLLGSGNISMPESKIHVYTISSTGTYVKDIPTNTVLSGITASELAADIIAGIIPVLQFVIYEDEEVEYFICEYGSPEGQEYRFYKANQDYVHQLTLAPGTSDTVIVGVNKVTYLCKKATMNGSNKMVSTNGIIALGNVTTSVSVNGSTYNCDSSGNVNLGNISGGGSGGDVNVIEEIQINESNYPVSVANKIANIDFSKITNIFNGGVLAINIGNYYPLSNTGLEFANNEAFNIFKEYGTSAILYSNFTSSGYVKPLIWHYLRSSNYLYGADSGTVEYWTITDDPDELSGSELTFVSISIDLSNGNISILKRIPFSSIATDISTLQSNVSTIQGDLSDAETDISTLQTNVSTISGKMDTWVPIEWSKGSRQGHLNNVGNQIDALSW